FSTQAVPSVTCRLRAVLLRWPTALATAAESFSALQAMRYIHLKGRRRGLPSRQVGSGGHIMKTAIASAILAASLALAPLPASAHERVGDAAIGAAAGARHIGPDGDGR